MVRVETRGEYETTLAAGARGVPSAKGADATPLRNGEGAPPSIRPGQFRKHQGGDVVKDRRDTLLYVAEKTLGRAPCPFRHPAAASAGRDQAVQGHSSMPAG